MRQIRLTRVATNAEEGTFGTWVVDGQPMAVTVEPYKRDNAPSVSCVPTGQYILTRRYSSKYGNHFMVNDVQGRSHILIHSGNIDDHTLGCIILGENFGVINGQWAVQSSKKAFNEFMAIMAGTDSANLTIVESF